MSFEYAAGEFPGAVVGSADGQEAAVFGEGREHRLRWSDLDLDSRVLYVRQQTQRRRGVLYDDDPKSRRRRAIPLPALCIAPLRWHRMRQADARAKAGGAVAGVRLRLYHPYRPPGRASEHLPLLHSIAESAGLRVIRLHDARHGTATLLTAAGVAPRVVM